MTAPATSMTSQMPTRVLALPKLTPTEQVILFDHQGCFKCRQLYVDHKGANCPNDFPLAGMYKMLTTDYVEAVRDSKNKPHSRVMGPVVHVGYSVDEAMAGLPLAVLGVGEEDSDNSSKYIRTHHPPPFSSGHLE